MKFVHCANHLSINYIPIRIEQTFKVTLSEDCACNAAFSPRVDSMAQTDTSRRPIGSSFTGLPAMKSFASSFRSKKKGKSRRNNLSSISKAASLQPDLDIVSGFAFLSFSNIDDLECHIEDHEVNTRSLTIKVGEKRKIRPSNKDKPVAAGSACVSKRIKIPSQKILENYATSDITLAKTRPTVSHELKRTKVKPFPGSKTTSTNSSRLDPHFSQNSKNEGNLPKLDSRVKEITGAEMSLECSERIDICLFEDEEACNKQATYPSNASGIEPVHPTADVEEVMVKKKKKKRKRDKNINDQTCQTMFRIKKKKKNLRETEDSSIKSVENLDGISTPCLKDTEETVQDSSGTSTNLTQDASQSKVIEFIDCEKLTNSSVPAQTETDMDEVEEDICSRTMDKYQSKVQAVKSQDLKAHRLKISNKVEKIDYCARSGGVSLVERYHERQNKLKQDEPSRFVSCGQQFPSQWENDSQDSCDASVTADNSSDISGNDSSNNSSYDEQDTLINTKSRIFSGSSSVFVSSLDETNDTSEIDIESEGADDLKLSINIIKALPKSYMFGHLSTYPDKTLKGTVDVSIQAYDNDIQLYMNYAADFKGKIIKIIVPDNEDSKNCFPRSTSLSGLPKFLQPQEYVKAVRCATERNRRHNIGDLFQGLKNELFEDVRDFYFSKQAILTKAIETVEQSERESIALDSEKSAICLENQLLRKKLNVLLFGEDLADGKMLDLDKVTEYLKTFNIEIEIPLDDPKKGSSVSKERDSYMTNDNQSKHTDDTPHLVTRKGRPPLQGKYLKTFSSLQSEPQLKLPILPKPLELSRYVRAAFNNKMKEFVSIAPSDNNEVLSVEQSKSVVKDGASSEKIDNISDKSNTVPSESTNDSSVNKIVCNLTKYRIHQQPGSSRAMTIVTNPEPLKGIESKNVVHIKISNDTMKHVGVMQDISTLSNKQCVPSNTSNSGDAHNVQVSDGVPLLSSYTIQNTHGTSKLMYKDSRPLDPSKSSSNLANITTKSTLTACKSSTFIPGLQNKTTSSPLATSKTFALVHVQSQVKKDQGPLSTTESIQSQAKVGEVVTTSKSTESASGVPISTLKDRTSCSKETTAPGNKEVACSLADVSVKEEATIATEQLAVTEGSKIIIVKESATTPTYMMAKPQCSSRIGVSQTTAHQTLHRNQPVLTIQKHFTTVKPYLLGKPLISLAKVQPSQVTSHVPMRTLGSIATQNTPVIPMKQVLTTKVNTPHSPTVLPMTTNATMATKVMPVLHMAQLKAANLTTPQSIALLPMTTNTTLTTQGTPVLQKTQSTSAKVATPQSIAVLPMTTHLTMATQGTTVSKVTTPHGIALGSAPTAHPSAPRYVAIVRAPNPNTPHTVSRKTFLVPNSALPSSSSPFRIVFKPTGQPKVVHSPFPQITNAIQSSSVVGLPISKANTVPLKQNNNVSVTTPISETPKSKVFIQDKMPITNKQVNTNKFMPVQYRHLMMQAPPMHIVNATKLQQPKTLVRIQPPNPSATPPILTSLCPTPVKSTHIQQTSKIVTNLASHSVEGINTVSKPPTIGVPLHSTTSSIKQLLVAGPLNSPLTIQGTTSTSNSHPVLMTTSVAGLASKPIPTEGRSANVFNLLSPQSGSVQVPGTRFISLGHQESERQVSRRLSELQIPQLTPNTSSDSVSVGSKETFSEMEKMLAKIPSPNVINSLPPPNGNVKTNNSNFNGASILTTSIVHTSCPQTVDYNERTTTPTMATNTNNSTLCSNGQVFNTVRPQTLADTKCSSQSQTVTASKISAPFKLISSRDRLPSYQSKCSNSQATETTRPTSITYSNTCISTTVSFDDPKGKGDKTCSVVDSPELIGHVVTADTLSVCNIDSSIPDITSELISPDQINPSSSEYSSQNNNVTEWRGNKESSLQNKESNTEKNGSDFELQDESTAEDFDILSSFEWNNKAPNDNSAVSPAGHS